jgi:hypothetical protein
VAFLFRVVQNVFVNAIEQITRQGDVEFLRLAQVLGDVSTFFVSVGVNTSNGTYGVYLRGFVPRPAAVQPWAGGFVYAVHPVLADAGCDLCRHSAGAVGAISWRHAC